MVSRDHELDIGSVTSGQPELTADFTRALPGGKLDDATYEAIEDALDKVGAPSTVGGRWLTLAERVTALRADSAEDLIRRIDLTGQPDNSRLIVMAQNPANNHHWSLSVGKFTAGEVRAALAKAEAAP